MYSADSIYGVPAPQALLAALIGYGCANTAFAGLAITLVLRREQAILKRLRATPLPPATYIAALLVSTLIVFALQTVALFLLGRVVFGTPFPTRRRLARRSLVLGAAVLRGARVATASLIRSAEGSSAVVNFILLPMAFLTGSFGPTQHYPRVPARDRRRASAEVPCRPRERGLSARVTRSGRSRGARRARGLGRSRTGRCGVEVPMGAAEG